MKESKQDRETRNIELVETGNIAKSLNRLQNAPAGCSAKRALYHAICMSYALTGFEERKLIREALGLP